MTLPVILLLMDFWPLGRFEKTRPPSLEPAVPVSRAASGGKKRRRAETQRPPAIQADTRKEFRRFIPLFVEKVQLLALSIAAGMVALVTQQKSGAVLSSRSCPSGSSRKYARVYFLYLGKTIWRAGVPSSTPCGPGRPRPCWPPPCFWPP